jgi:flagellar secretion chaperone FliS
MYSCGIETYRKTHVITADPRRLIILCYEGAIDQLLIAKSRYLAKDYEGKSRALSKAQDFISELLCSLDLEQGGVIAQNLKALYNYMLLRLFRGDLARDLNAYEEVIRMLNELRSAWESLLDHQDSEKRRAAAL